MEKYLRNAMNMLVCSPAVTHTQSGQTNFKTCILKSNNPLEYLCNKAFLRRLIEQCRSGKTTMVP